MSKFNVGRRNFGQLALVATGALVVGAKAARRDGFMGPFYLW